MSPASPVSLPLPPQSAPALPDAEEVSDLERVAPDATSLLAWALEHFGSRIALVTSFQAEGIVLLDLARRLDRDVRVLTLDTGRLPPETHELIEAVSRRFDVTVEVVHPDHAALDALVRARGPNLFRRSLEDRQACCRVRKVEPLARSLDGLDAWITGLRRGQSLERRGTPRVAIEPGPVPRLKLAPLADWAEARVWAHIRRHDLPYHPFYDRGYRSIGCAPCSRPVRMGEGPRSGRWWWEDGDGKKECGLHPRVSTLPIVPAGGTE